MTGVKAGRGRVDEVDTMRHGNWRRWEGALLRVLQQSGVDVTYKY